MNQPLVDELLLVLEQIQNNASARKWNSQSQDRADVQAFTDIENQCKAAISRVEKIRNSPVPIIFKRGGAK